MFCESNSIKCKVIIVILFVLFMFSIVFGGIYKKMNHAEDITNQNGKKHDKDTNV